MAKRGEATRLPAIRKATPKVPVIGVFATSDPRIDEDALAAGALEQKRPMPEPGE